MQEPMVYCQKCNISHTMLEGARMGMRCPQCGLSFTSQDSNWMSGVMSKEDRGNAPSLSPKKQAFVDNTPVQSFAQDRSSNEIRVGELWLPGHNEVDAQGVLQFLSSMPTPVSFEYFGAGSRRVMLVRGPLSALKFIANKIVSVWPSAYMHILDKDPLQDTTEKGVIQYDVAFRLAEAHYLPLKTWDSYLKGDPVHNLLASISGLYGEERVWLQFLVARKGEPEWLRDVQRRLKLEQQRGFVVNADASSSTLVNTQPVNSLNIKSGAMYLLFIVVALVAVVAGFSSGSWLVFSALAVGLLIVVGGLMMLFGKRQDDWFSSDLELIRQKAVQQDAYYQVMVRASVWSKTPERGQELLGHVLSALSQYSISGGNRFQVSDSPLPSSDPWPVGVTPETPDIWSWLSPSEIGGMWHIPVNNERVSPGLVPVYGVEVRAPDPDDVKGFYEIGHYFRPDGEEEPVFISSAALMRNVFLIGKPGVGKTNLMEHLVLAGAQDPERPAVVVIDPHGDMADRLLGILRPEDAERVVIMDVGDPDYAMTYNPLDVHSHGWSVDEVTNLITDIGRSLWSDYWGPRMQVPLRSAVRALAAANEGRPKGEALGLSVMASFLNASHDIRRRFIEAELDGSKYYAPVTRYFYNDYKSMSPNLREQVISPVLSKAYRFEENPLLGLFSSLTSKLDPGDIVRNRKILIVNTRMSKFGSEMSDFVGSLIINVLMREIARQGDVSPDNRAPVMMVVDEFQTYTGVDWQELVAQLRKWGGRAALGTQSLASLRDDTRDLVGVIMSGVYSVFTFMMNGEDAKYLSENEMSSKEGGPTAATLTNLEPFRSYARIVRADGRVTRPFYFAVAPPKKVNFAQRDAVFNARSKYSLPRDIAEAKALEKISYLDQYGGSLLSAGVGGSSTQRSVSPSESKGIQALKRASNILRGEDGDGASEHSNAAPKLWNSLNDSVSGFDDDEEEDIPMYPTNPIKSTDDEVDGDEITRRSMAPKPIIPDLSDGDDDDDDDDEWSDRFNDELEKMFFPEDDE